MAMVMSADGDIPFAFYFVFAYLIISSTTFLFLLFKIIFYLFRVLSSQVETN